MFINCHCFICFLQAVPHSRREHTDSVNDETFGSSEFSTQDRAEEEKRRRGNLFYHSLFSQVWWWAMLLVPSILQNQLSDAYEIVVYASLYIQNLLSWWGKNNKRHSKRSINRLQITIKKTLVMLILLHCWRLQKSTKANRMKTCWRSLHHHQIPKLILQGLLLYMSLHQGHLFHLVLLV